MRIQFLHLKEEGHNPSGATERDVIWAVTHPIQKQRLQITELTILLFLSKAPSSDNYLLAIGQYEGNEYLLRQCLKVRSELVEKVGSYEPLVLLRQLAENFGAEQEFYGQTSKFFYRESIKVPTSKLKHPSKLLDFKTQKIRVLYGFYYIFRRESNILEIALAFSINIDLYKSWLAEQTTTTLSPKKYDVFISYKRNTAKDLAENLKKCLTEEGYTAFLDLTDIRKEFDGTATWLKERDDAIRNSKRFLLIMTINIEKSEEVANELTIARTVEKMKFIYLRDDTLKPQIILKTRNYEEIDLSKGNQETFTNEVDMLRKVLKILQESERETL